MLSPPISSQKAASLKAAPGANQEKMTLFHVYHGLYIPCSCNKFLKNAVTTLCQFLEFIYIVSIYPGFTNLFDKKKLSRNLM